MGRVLGERLSILMTLYSPHLYDGMHDQGPKRTPLRLMACPLSGSPLSCRLNVVYQSVTGILD